MGIWIENKTYYDRSEPDGDNVLASLVMGQGGFSFFRLNRDLEYYMLMKQPEEGFASYFRVTDDLVSLFAFLGKRENLESAIYISHRLSSCRFCDIIVVTVQSQPRKLSFSRCGVSAK